MEKARQEVKGEKGVTSDKSKASHQVKGEKAS